MKALKFILLFLLIAIIGFAIYIAVQPNSFEVTRTKTINAPQPVVYNEVIDFENWEAWSAWVEERPDTKITLGEQTDGVGGNYMWEDEDGIGRMKTVDADPFSSITQEMQFEDFPKSKVVWQFEPNDKGTTDVKWNISGEDLPFVFKMFSTLMGGMESQIGPKYERSLTMLDSVLQDKMNVYSVNVEGVTQHSGGYYLYKTTSCKMSDFQSEMQKEFPKVGAYAISNNITFAGAPFVLYEKWDEENNAVIFSVCIPTNSRIISNDPDILTGQLESFKAVKTVLMGNYDHLKEAWEKTMAYIEDNNLETVDGGSMLEIYPTDPSSVPNPADWKTEIYIEVK
ncbi:GyrI-like domain-containing protein [Winogradskyella sp.]|uniref:SRPBCC family protein n=1 Tax=Winogradskyella sp. TaxID=1883156 RepID=UPI001B15F469|nr:GyrI-like domain-containing protein [Winogradskyella sp.]MBO6880571.1 SRPBCC family protein [Winogradskyella sp.]